MADHTEEIEQEIVATKAELATKLSDEIAVILTEHDKEVMILARKTNVKINQVTAANNKELEDSIKEIRESYASPFLQR